MNPPRATRTDWLLALTLGTLFLALAWWAMRHNQLRANGPTAADTHTASAQYCETRARLGQLSRPAHNPLADASAVAFPVSATKVVRGIHLSASGSISIHQHAKSATAPWAKTSRLGALGLPTRIPPMVVSGGCAA